MEHTNTRMDIANEAHKKAAAEAFPKLLKFHDVTKESINEMTDEEFERWAENIGDVDGLTEAQFEEFMDFIASRPDTISGDSELLMELQAAVETIRSQLDAVKGELHTYQQQAWKQ